jgi:hypothetical protein
MSTALAGTGQRKRKLDSPPDVGNKRKRSNDTPSKTTENYAFTTSCRLRITRGKSSTIDRSDSLGPEHGSSNAELSSDTETSSDSDTETSSDSDTETSSDSDTSSTDPESDDESEDSENDSSSDNTDSDRGPLGYESDMISLPAQSKPSMFSSTTVTVSSDLRLRVASFLPQLQKANEEVVTAGDDQRIDAIAEDQDQYIEMDLGLGVLKEKRPRSLNGEIQTHEISSSSSSSSSNSDDDESETGYPWDDAMFELRGRKEARSSNGRPVIQDIDET